MMVVIRPTTNSSDEVTWTRVIRPTTNSSVEVMWKRVKTVRRVGLSEAGKFEV